MQTKDALFDIICIKTELCNYENPLVTLDSNDLGR